MELSFKNIFLIIFLTIFFVLRIVPSDVSNTLLSSPQVLANPSLDCDVTWYVSSSPCVACAEKLTHVLRQRKKLRLRILCSRLLQWEEPEIREGLRALNSAGCKLQIMKPSDFQLVWDTYVDKEAENFAAWEDCKENYEFYEEKLSEILQ